MIQNKSFFFGLVLGVLAALLVVWAYWMFDTASEAAYHSCIASAQDRISIAVALSRRKGKIDVDDTWKTLSSGETSMVFNNFENGPSFDCARFQYISSGKNAEGNSLDISVRRVAEKIEVRLLNVGRVCSY